MEIPAWLVTTLPLALSLAYVLHRRRRTTRPGPAEAFAGAPRSGAVHVPGEVLRPRGPFMTGRWRIRYPLPDGSSAQVSAVYTRPPVLRPGMVVPVRVDLATRQARLDYPPHTARVRLVVRLIVGTFLVIGVTGAAIAVPLVLAARQ